MAPVPAPPTALGHRLDRRRRAKLDRRFMTAIVCTIYIGHVPFLAAFLPMSATDKEEDPAYEVRD